MTWWETFRIALDAIVAHRVRSILTTLGITIGIAAVTLSVGLAQGASSAVTSSMGDLGSNMLTVMGGYYGPVPADGMMMAPTEQVPLTVADADALADRSVAPDIAGVAPVINTGFELTAGDKVAGTNAEATTTSWLSVRSRTLASGRFFTDEEYADAAPVVVLGTQVAEQLFGDPFSAVGQMVSANGSSFRVIGVLTGEGSVGGMMGADDMAAIPMTTYRERLAWGDDPVSAIYVQAASVEKLPQAYQETEALLLGRRGVTSPDQGGFMIMAQQSLVDAMAEVTNALTLLLGGIAAISLVVGGIGVMNIMLVSVTERIREIGLRMAVGAGPSDVRRQFLAEAMLISLIGGVIGIAIGVVGALLVGKFGDLPVELNAKVVTLAAAFSVCTGLFFGYYPARKASLLDPIEALRAQ